MPSDRYVRHSATRDQASQIEQVVAESAPCQRYLPADARKAFVELEALARGGLERQRESANARYVERVVPSVRQTVHRDLNVVLTDEQARAIAADEDATLVLAGAGTGKTSVIAGKVAWLVDSSDVSPDEILVLAYNRNAAEELRERLPNHLKADVQTFHAFARRVSGEVSGAAPSISKLATGTALLPAFIERSMEGLIADPATPKSVITFLTDQPVPYRSPFDFKTKAEYDAYVKNGRLVTLNGEFVRSFEELTIANFLARNGIAYEYERAYPYPTATRVRRQYQPDFTIHRDGWRGDSVGEPLYIEHFALDAKGKPPKRWGTAASADYAAGVQWKRQLHKQQGTELLETYSWQNWDGTLLTSLSGRLIELGVPIKPVPHSELLTKLRKALQFSNVAALLTSFLHHLKTSMLTAAALRDRASNFPEPKRAAAFLDLFELIEACYATELENEGAVDFDDLIRMARDHLMAGRWRSDYRYVLVDEFQDISAGRIALLSALLPPGAACTVVGDDWQSIYRFAGSDVRLVRGASEYLGHTDQRELQQTFRFRSGILNPATEFIRRNPAQSQREMRPASSAGVDNGVTIIAKPPYPGAPSSKRTAERRGLAESLTTIAASAATSENRVSVLVLGRYQASKNLLEPSISRHQRLDLEFSTVHRAKGREADFVVVLDLVEDRRGFPSRIEDDPLLDLAAPPLGDFPDEEERRLFYVALTRARHGVFLVTNPTKPSAFVKELARASPAHVKWFGELTSGPECPICRGRLIPSQSKRNLRCDGWPGCTFQAPECRACQAGYLLRSRDSLQCTNSRCAANFEHQCPNCHYGVLVERRGPRGRFLGCTRYWEIPPCEYTRPLDA